MHGTFLFTPSQLGLDPDLHVFLPSRWGANLLEKKHEISLKYLENDILHLHMRHLEAAWQFWGQGNACFHLSCPWSSARDWWLPTMWCQRPSEAFGRRRCVMKLSSSSIKFCEITLNLVRSREFGWHFNIVQAFTMFQPVSPLWETSWIISWTLRLRWAQPNGLQDMSCKSKSKSLG